MDDSLLDENEPSVSSQIPTSQKNRSLEDKLDRFFNEFANFFQKLQNLEQKDSESAGSRSSSVRDSVHVAKPPVVKSKTQPLSSSVNLGAPGRLERRSATVTRAEFEQQSGAGQFSDESGRESRKRSFSQSSEDPDPDLEQGEIRSREEDTPAYSETLETIKNSWIYRLKMLSVVYHLQFSLVEIRSKSLCNSPWLYLLLNFWWNYGGIKNFQL